MAAESSPLSRKRAVALARIAEAHARFDRALALTRDPVQFPRSYAGRDDREVVALLSALLAFGNVETIRAKLRVLLGILGPSPSAAAMNWSPKELHRRLDSFRHRTFRGEDIAQLLHAAGTVMREQRGLYHQLERVMTDTGRLQDGLIAFTDQLRGLAWPSGMTRSARHLVPDPRGASACKRLALLSRWIVRPDDGVDLGLLNAPTRALVIPLDVHVHRVARTLGLTSRKGASWQAALEVTEALRALDFEDPVRYDFAICHVEIQAYRKNRVTESPTAQAKELTLVDRSKRAGRVRNATRHSPTKSRPRTPSK